MTTLASYISNHFRVIYCHPESQENDWDTFLLGEDHHDQEMQKANYAFIRIFSDHQSGFLVEGLPSLSPAKYPEIHFAIKKLPENEALVLKDSEGNSRVYGWDMNDFLKLDAKRQAKKNLHSLFSDLFHESLAASGTGYDCNMEIRPRLLEKTQIQKIQDHLASHKEDTNEWGYKSHCMNLLEQAIEEVAQEGQAYIDQEVTSIESKRKATRETLAAVSHNVDQLMDRFGESDSIDVEVEQAFEEENALRTRLDGLEKEVYDLLHRKKIEIQDWLWNFTSPDFLSRTHAMIQTLKGVRKVTGVQGKIFLIAGKDHLEEPGKGLPEDDPKSLKSFTDYIAQHKNIVVLCPKAHVAPKFFETKEV